mgnify:FL=1
MYRPSFVRRTAVILAVACLGLATVAGAAVLHVGGGYGYATIADAVSAASDGDRVLVHPGTYDADFTIDRTLTIEGVPGEDRPLLVSDGGALGAAIVIDANNVVLRRLEVTHDDGVGNGTLIEDNGNSGWTVEKCELHHARRGVLAFGSDVTIRNNDIHDMNTRHVALQGSGPATITGNWIHDANTHGVAPDNVGYSQIFGIEIEGATSGTTVVADNHLARVRCGVKYEPPAGGGPIAPGKVVVEHNTFDGDWPTVGDYTTFHSSQGLALWSRDDAFNSANIEVRDNIFYRTLW